MAAPLNIRDLGEARKAALEAEARRQGLSVAETVRALIDDGIERAEAERARSAWVASAQAGLADEARHLETRGPTLARFRRR